MRREAPVGSGVSNERPRGSERYWLVVGRDRARSKTLTLHSRPYGEILCRSSAPRRTWACS
jgi:hypothetical protein